MQKLPARLLCAAIFFSGVIAGVSDQASAETLVGDTVELWRHPQSNGVTSLDSAAIVTTPTHEFEGQIIDTIWTMNVEATSIRLDVVSPFFSPYFNSGFDPTYYEVRDLDFVGEPGRYIAGIDVSFSNAIGIHQDSPLGWPAFSAGNVTFTGDSVRVSIGGYEFQRGDYVQVNLITAPEPAAAALLGLGGLVLIRRRR